MDEKSNHPAGSTPMPLAVDEVEQIESRVLSLPRAARVRILETLNASLEMDPEVEQEWTEEVRRRIRDIDSGVTKLVPGDEVLKQAEDLLRE